MLIDRMAKGRLPPLAASTKAAASVGPAQGAQTSASRAPAPACPSRPECGNRVCSASAHFCNGASPVSSRWATAGNNRARPMSRISTAATSRNAPESPKSTPSDARKPPTTPNVTAIPAARARGPRGFSARAPATTTGTSGRTQGLRIVITPAKNDKGRVQTEITAPPSSKSW